MKIPLINVLHKKVIQKSFEVKNILNKASQSDIKKRRRNGRLFLFDNILFY